MFHLAVLIGIYSLSVFFLGWAGLLTKGIIGSFSVVFWGIAVFVYRYRLFVMIRRLRIIWSFKRKEKAILAILLLLAGANLAGALGPELAFDALWYHLTIPKIYIEDRSVSIISGNLLYYTGFPKLGEMLFTVGLLFSNEIAAKLIHFSFGIGCVAVTYKIARLYLSRKLSLISSFLFYSNLVVMWLSTTAYIDLIRTFYDSLAIFAFLSFENKRKSFLVLSGILLGFAVSTKLISAITVLAIIATILLTRDSFRRKFLQIAVFIIPVVIITFPWFAFNYIKTGNLFYPFFEGYFESGGISLDALFVTVKDLLLTSSDPVSPIYLISIPLIAMFFGKVLKSSGSAILLTVITFTLLLFTPYSNSRFMVSYLPLYSVVVVLAIDKSPKIIRNSMIVLIFLIALLSGFYRAAANVKYLPVILGEQSKEEFLMNNLNFDFGDFYDEGGEINNIVKNDKVLLVNMHNLYYVRFPYVHESWVKNDSEFKFALVQQSNLPAKYNGEVVYSNDKTRVKLYRLYEENN